MDSPARVLLENAREQMRKAGISETYEHFNSKKELNDILRNEQMHICCYCQQRITHHNAPPNEGGSHNEHFYPEKGPNGCVELQLSYENLYACCNVSKDFEERLKYCGWSKHETLLPINFLSLRECSDLFKYNLDGEILPVGPFRSYGDFIANRELLPTQQQEVLNFIDVLKLNIESLTLARRQIMEDIMSFMKNKTIGQLQHKIQLLNNPVNKEFVPMVDMVIYFLKQRVARL